MIKFKIIVKTLQGRILTYSVDEYKVIDGFVTFIDLKNNANKRFAVSNVEIIEVNNNGSR